MLVSYLSLSPLIAAEGYFFCLETKEAKIQAAGKAFVAQCQPFAIGMPSAQKLAPQSVSHSLSATF